METLLYTLTFLAGVIFYVQFIDDDDDEGGGTLIPAYQQSNT